MSKPAPFSDELISAYLDGELPDAQRLEVEEVLARSDEHRRLLDDLLALRADLQTLPQYRLDDDFSNRVLQRAEREMLTRGAAPAQTEPVTPERGAWRGLVWAAVAVAAALLIMLFGPNSGKEPGNGRDNVVEEEPIDGAAGPNELAVDPVDDEGDIGPGPRTIEGRTPESNAIFERPSSPEDVLDNPDFRTPVPRDEGDTMPRGADGFTIETPPSADKDEPAPTDQGSAMVNAVEVEDGGLLYVVELTIAAKSGEDAEIDSSVFDEALVRHGIEYRESTPIDSAILATIVAQLKKQRPGGKFELIYVEASGKSMDGLILACVKGLPADDDRVTGARSELATSDATDPEAPDSEAPLASDDGSAVTQDSDVTGPQPPEAADSSDPQRGRPDDPPQGVARRLDPARLEAEAAAAAAVADTDSPHAAPKTEEELFSKFGALFILRAAE